MSNKGLATEIYVNLNLNIYECVTKLLYAKQTAQTRILGEFNYAYVRVRYTTVIRKADTKSLREFKYEYVRMCYRIDFYKLFS